jgi:2-(1,2-epoxy-1,2-dihydrophenyl)acetyl-CoA isomerase
VAEQILADEEAVASGEVILRIEDGVAYATVHRPKARNAMAPHVRRPLTRFVESLKTNTDVRVLLLQATGPSFIAGGDVKSFSLGLEMTPEARAEDMRGRAAGAGVFSAALASIPQPVIVAGRGPSVGVGASIMLAADLVMLSENAMLRLSHVTLGISPDGLASWFLPRVVGLKRANQIAMLGDAITAQEALALGLVNWVFPDEDLDAEAEKLARRLAAGAPQALAEIKRLLLTSGGRDMDAQISAEAESLRRCALTDDYAEGLRAVLERRTPRFG